jgi:small subunit ribosomal protein S17e
MQVLDKHKSEFTTDFAENKKILDQIAIIRSKGLKNEMAGFITKYIKLEAATKAQKQQREARAEAEREQTEEVEEITAQIEPTPEQVEEDAETDSEQEEIVMESQSRESN